MERIYYCLICISLLGFSVSSKAASVTTVETETTNTYIYTTVSADYCSQRTCDGCYDCRLSGGSCACSCIVGYFNDLDGSCIPKTCPRERLPYPNDASVGNITFPETQSGFSNISDDKCSETFYPYATRMCLLGGTWSSPVWISSCNITIQSIADGENVTIDSIRDLSIVTSSNAATDSDDVKMLVDVVDRFIEDRESIDQDSTDLVVSVVSNLVGSVSGTISTTANDSDSLTNRIGETIAGIADKVEVESDATYNTTSSQISLIVFNSSLREDGVNLTARTGMEQSAGLRVQLLPIANQTGFRQDQVEFIRQLNDEHQESSYIYLSFSTSTDSNGSRVSFYTYFDTSVFDARRQPLPPTYTNFTVDSTLVLSAQALNVSSVQLRFNSRRGQGTVMTSHNGDNDTSSGVSKQACAFWDESESVWTIDEGARVDDVTGAIPSSFVSCRFDHLTNFASLFLYGPGAEIRSEGLDIVTVVGCSISLVCQLTTVIFYCALKEKVPAVNSMRTFYLLNLAFALIALNSSIVASFVHKRSRDLSGEVPCVVISVLVHFSLISVILWTAADTFFLFVNVAYPFYARATLRRKSSMAGVTTVVWVCAATFVAVPAAFKPDIYQRDDDTCWMNVDWILYLVILPIAVILAFDCFAFVVILYIAKFKPRPGTQRHTENKPSRLAFALILFVTVGGTWLIGFGITPLVNASPQLGLAFSYIFAALNSLQGAILFFIFFTRIMESSRREEEVKNNYRVKKNSENATRSTALDNESSSPSS